jgi:fructose-1,6-bisphosphatase/inositol monophosphatase family enzyme
MKQGDGYFGAGFHIWDIAASGLIVTEAGGVLRNMKGEKLNLLKRQIIASATLTLANEIASKISSIELKSD